MKDMNKTKKQLLDEIDDLCCKINMLETGASRRAVNVQRLMPDDGLYRFLIEQTNEAILVIQDEKIRYVNNKTTEITGYSKKELRTKIFIDLIHPEDRHLISRGAIPIYNEENTSEIFTCRIIDKHETIRWLETRLLCTAEFGKSVIMCFLKDVTGRKMATEALLESEGKYRQLVEHAPAGIYEVDMTSGKFVSFNDLMCEYTGYSKEEFRNLKMWDLLTEESQRKQLMRLEKMLAGEPVPEEAEHEIICKNGEIMSILVYTRINYENGQAVRANTIAHNITERKRMQKEHQLLAAELSKAQKLESLGVLAGGIGHDFNNLLSGIIGNISLAKLEAERGENIMESLDEALRVSSKASALTQQLLVFSKGGAPVKKAASIAEVLRDSAAFTLRGSRVKCHFDIPADLWPVEVDVGQFSQVIHNLVINAMQAMSSGGEIQLVAKNILLAEISDVPLNAGRYVLIELQDQGSGIEPEHLPYIFDPYFTTKSKGSGLGLTISYATIKRHDGHITVASERDSGTTFRIYLPASEVRPEELAIEDNLAVKGEGRVLVMDDEEILRKVAERMLLELGYEVQCAEDGLAAIELYEKALLSGNPFDAVIMDLTIPGGLGGKETIKKLLHIDSSATAIVSSGYSNDPIMSNYEKFGFRGVVVKPYKIEELSWAIRDALEAAKK